MEHQPKQTLFTPRRCQRQQLHWLGQKGQNHFGKILFKRGKKKKSMVNWNSHRVYLQRWELTADHALWVWLCLFSSTGRNIQASRSIKYNHRFNYRASLEIYWPHFWGLQNFTSERLARLASANYMIYRVIYGGWGDWGNQVALTIHQMSKAFSLFFKHFVSSPPRPSIKNAAGLC